MVWKATNLWGWNYYSAKEMSVRLQNFTHSLHKVIDLVEEAVKFSLLYYSLGDNE